MSNKSKTNVRTARDSGSSLQRFVSRQWQDITMINADCRQVLPEITMGAIVTDPPYGLDYKPQRSLSKCKKWQSQKPFEAVKHDDEDFEPEHLLALNVPMVLWGGNHYADKLPPSGGWLVWDKKRGGTISRGFVGSDVELAWTNIGGTAKIYNYMWCGLCRDGEVGEHYHPTQKPVNLMAWCVSLTPDDAIICDPYAGSGTTAIACIRTGRKFIGIEKDPKHYQTACERIDRELAQGVLLPANSVITNQVAKATNANDLDLSKIAVKHGGGGHKGACGFETKYLPWLPTAEAP